MGRRGHLLDGPKAEPIDCGALPIGQRRLPLDALGLEHAQWHGHEDGVRRDAIAAALGVHAHAIGAVLDERDAALAEHLEQTSSGRFQLPRVAGARARRGSISHTVWHSTSTRSHNAPLATSLTDEA